MSFTIRPFRSPDLPAICSLTVDAFEPVSIERNIENHFGTIAGRDWRWRKARHVEQDVQRDLDGIFVAEINEVVVGYVTTWIDRPAGVGFIPNLAVDASVRGQGIGRALLQQALTHFRRQGIQYARIETLEQNPIGQSLYPTLGFQEVARQIHYCMRIPDSYDQETGNAKTD